MKQKVQVDIPTSSKIILELNDEHSPKTTKLFLDNLPFSVQFNVWGEEIYTSESPIIMSEENAKSPVSLNDVAYWPTGKAICLFYGPTPMSDTKKIIPASPVNVIGKIINPDKSILDRVEGKIVTFVLQS